MKLCFLHGLDSSPRGTKASLLKKLYPSCLVPELPEDAAGRVLVVEKQLKEPVLVIGSSLGGLTALQYAMRHPDMVLGLVLMAPAVGGMVKELLNEKQREVLDSVYVPEGIPTVIIAGIRDEVVPLSAVHSLIKHSPEPEHIKLYEVDDDHDLHQSLDLMVQAIENMKRKLSRYGQQGATNRSNVNQDY